MVIALLVFSPLKEEYQILFSLKAFPLVFVTKISSLIADPCSYAYSSARVVVLYSSPLNYAEIFS